MEPDWNDFKIILALARGGSVAGAARMLAIDQSTASRRLAALEDAMGARLVVRGGREFTWTDEGRAALAAAEAAEAAVSIATRTIRTAKLEVAGTVRVSCPPGFVPDLMKMLPAARRKFPLLEIELNGDYRRVDLAKGEADIALRMARPSEAGLVARLACETGWAVYASAGYAAEQGLPASIDELADHPLVLYVESMHNVAPLRWMEDHRRASTRITRVDNLEIATQIMSSGGGIGVIPCFIAMRSPELRRVFPQPVAFNTGWLVYYETARDTARVRATVDALLEFFDSNKALFSGRIEREGAG